MSRTKFWYVNCDQCGDEGSAGEGSYGSTCRTLANYLAKLRTDGWTFGTRDICEECNGNGPKARARAKQVSDNDNANGNC